MSMSSGLMRRSLDRASLIMLMALQARESTQSLTFCPLGGVVKTRHRPIPSPCLERVPLVEAQVAVGELLQQRPLDDAFGGPVLKEIDQRVLQAGVLLRRGLLLGELVQARVLLVESLTEGGKWREWI